MALPHSLNITDYPPRFQFGQTNAPCGGKSCCTDTCIQMIAEFYIEKSYTLNDIRTRAQAKTNFDESPCTGINCIEATNAITSFGISYKTAWGVTANDVWNMVSLGPVLGCVWYGSYPNSVSACGPNKAEFNGRTDCNFSGAHAVLIIGKREHTVNGVTHRDFLVRDPDHNSPARPEKPKYDIITAGQLNKALVDLPKYSGFQQSAVIYPLKRKVLV